jgi:hypothetical protein
VDLRKVLGTENPADLLTKHSLTRDKLDYLVKLFGCEYLDGRAESAPQLRQGASGKTTVAEADGGNNTNNSINTTTTTVGGPDDTNINMPTGLGVEDGTPWMPHLVLNAEDLELQFPSIEAPEEDQYEDLVKETDDIIFNHGMKLAERIVEDMFAKGRTRDDPLKARIS